MQLMSPEDSVSDKISSSIKKSHKISIYSKKSTKSPKKNEPTVISRFQEARQFQAGFLQNSEKPSDVNSLNGIKFNNNHNQNYFQFANNNNSMELNRGSHRTMNIVDLSKYDHKGGPSRQFSYHEQRGDTTNNFFESNTPIIKKANNFHDNIFATGNQQKSNMDKNNSNTNTKNNGIFYGNSENQQRGHNISQMIDKQAESQLNNLSVLQGSFLTGVKSNSFNNTYHNISHTSSHQNIIPISGAHGKQNDSQAASQQSCQNQQYVMQNFMKFMQEQIYIAKQRYEKRITDLMKDNIKNIKDLKQKLLSNQLILKEKNNMIENMRKLKSPGNGYERKIQSQGQISLKRGSSAPQCNQVLQNFNIRSYYEKRISDLQAKISVLKEALNEKQQKSNQFQQKIHIIQKQLITYNHSKLKHLASRLQGFISKSQQKLPTVSNNIEQLLLSFQKFKQEQYGFNQNQINQQKHRISKVKKQLQEFMGKQFKYENYNIDQLHEKIIHFKDDLRRLENMQFENSKLIKQSLEKNVKEEQQQSHNQSKKKLYGLENSQRLEPQPKIITLSNINETYSKYTVTNPNMSKVSISELSHTQEYSHLIEKVSPNEKHFNSGNIYGESSHNRSNSQSLISMNFTEDPSQSMTPRIKESQSIRFNDQKQERMSNVALSKYTKNTDLKETCSQLQGSPPSGSKYYLPATKTSTSIHSIMVPNDSSTQEKIRNLNDLKMQTLPLLHGSKQTPQKININQQNLNSSLKSIYYANLSQLQQSLEQNNASYLSIGQMEDFNISCRDIVNETSDFSDDQFFYPGFREDTVNQWESPDKSYKTTQRFLQAEQSPMKKKLMSTDQHFYQSTKSPQVDTIRQSREKPSFMYSSSLDYEKFSDDENQDHAKQPTAPLHEYRKALTNFMVNDRGQQNNQQLKAPNGKYKAAIPLPQSQQYMKSLHPRQQIYSQNEQRVINSLRSVKKHELPIKMIYDRKKSEGIIKMIQATHFLNGKSYFLQKKQVQKLQSLGYIQVKTYI